MFDWEDMRVFSVLARSGSLAAAARTLKVNHATVGRRVAALEEALGVRLVDRMARGTPLTEQGAQIARFAHQMEETARAALRAARSSSASLTGTVTISAPPVIATEVITPSLAALRKLHPLLGITLLALPTLASLDHGEADIAVRLVRSEQPNHVFRRLGQVTFGLYAAADLACAPQEDWSFIAYDDELDHLPQQRWLSSYAGDRPILFRANDVYGQMAAARQALGVALLPCFLADREEGLVRVDPQSAPAPRTLWLVVHSDVRKAPAVGKMADHLIALFAEDSRFASA